MREYKKPFDEKYGKDIKFVRAEVFDISPDKLKRPFWDSTGGPFEFPPVGKWLKLYTEDGFCGECPCTDVMEKYLIEILICDETHDYDYWYEKCFWRIRNFGFMGNEGMEVGQLDWAFHDIMSKRANMPLHKFLGAKRDNVKIYWSCGGTNLTRAELVEELMEGVNGGYKCFKMKVATNFANQLDDDIERIALARKTIGSDVELAVDVNQVFEWQEALEFAKRIEKYNIAWLEEPVHSHDLLGLRELIKHSPVEIATGESMRMAYIEEVYVDYGVKHIQPCTNNMLGVREMVYLREFAKDKNIRLTSGGAFSVYSATILAGGREEDLVEVLVSVVNPARDYMKRNPKVENAEFILSDKPGADISLDVERLLKSGHITAIRNYVHK